MSGYDWMSQLPTDLHTIPLYKLAIPVYPKEVIIRHVTVPPEPGSHDSMSYDLDVNSTIIEPERLTRFSKICCLRRIIRRWATTQEVTITEQLNQGVRYFDLRIARKPNDSHPTRLYFHHGLYTKTDVETGLRRINTWAERHPKEVIILSLSHFHGFDKTTGANLHNHLIGFIKDLFGARLLPIMNNPSLKSCWDLGKNIIISYDYSANQQLWRKIPYFYGNSMDRAKITSKLQEALEKKKPSDYFFVCGLNPTLPHDVRIFKYILRLCDSFPKVIRRSLWKLLPWVQQQHEKTPMNIVASDVVTRDDFVPTVVKLNLKQN